MAMIRCWIAAAAVLVLAPAALANCTIKITAATPVNEFNVATTPYVGQPAYGLRVDFTVTGRPKASYPIRFRLFNRSVSFTVPATRTGRLTYFGWFRLPNDEDLPWSVEIDPDKVTGNTTPASASGRWTYLQLVPNTPFEFYHRQRMRAIQSFTIDWLANTSLSTLEMRTGAPYQARHQETISFTSQGGTLAVLGAYNHQFQRRTYTNIRPGQTTVGYSAQMDLFKVRTNPATLNRAAWPTSANTSSSIRLYLKMEDGTDAAAVTGLKSLVDRWAPAAGRTSEGPYRTARRLYRGTVAHLWNQRPASETLADIIRLRNADARGFSELFAAACRVVGIPARVVPGTISGYGPHTWTEIWLPSHGWVPQDPAFSDSLIPDGSAAAWFGVIPDGNVRFGTTLPSGWYQWRGSSGGPSNLVDVLTLSPS